jgi:phosphotriesterase-related protein
VSQSDMKGKVQTVLGPVSPEDLGPATTHEHLLIDFSCMFHPPTEASEMARAYEPITIENLGWVRHNHYSSRPNLLMLDEETAIAETTRYRLAGGGTIVDVTTIGIGRDPRALATMWTPCIPAPWMTWPRASLHSKSLMI